jgi:hypothetical protein
MGYFTIKIRERQERFMKSKFRPHWTLIFIPVISSLSCGGQSLLPQMPTFPAIPPSPSMNNVPTGSSPMSGDWTVDAEFGKLAFSVDPEGTVVLTAVIAVTNWTCGGTTLSTQLQSISQWPISNNEFIGDVNLNGSFHTMRIEGSYDETHKQFSGTWEEDAHGTVCSGTWESVSRN